MKLPSCPLIFLSLAIGLFSCAASVPAVEADAAQVAPNPLAATPVDYDEEEDDEEEESVNYRDQVREVQQWLNRRELERKGIAPGLDVVPAPQPSAPFPHYFQNKGYDAGGYRRLDDRVRTRLRDAPEDSSAQPAYRGGRHYWHKRWHRHFRVYPSHHAYRHYAYSGGSRHSRSQHHGRYLPARRFHVPRHVGHAVHRHAASVSHSKRRSRR